MAEIAEGEFVGSSLETASMRHFLGRVAAALGKGEWDSGTSLRVVDLGCGVGRLVCAAACELQERLPQANFAEFVGVEVCPARHKAAKQLADSFFSGVSSSPRCRFVCGDFREKAVCQPSHKTVLLHFVGVDNHMSSAEEGDFIKRVCSGNLQSGGVGEPLVIATADGVFARQLRDSGRFAACQGAEVKLQSSGEKYRMHVFRAQLA